MSEFELEKTYVLVDIDKLVKSNIKYISVPLNRFVEWQCLDLNRNFLSKNEMFNKCLNIEDGKKAKELSRIYCANFWNFSHENNENL